MDGFNVAVEDFYSVRVGKSDIMEGESSSSVIVSKHKREPPPQGWIKINTERRTVIAFVVRNCMG